MSLNTYRISLASRHAIVVACTLAAASLSHAATIVLDNGLVNVVSAASDDLEVQNGPGGTTTVLSVIPGADIAAIDDAVDPSDGRSIGLTENSVLLFSGGKTAGDIQAVDNSVGFIVGAAEVGGNVVVEGSAEVQISSDAVIDGDLLISGDSTVNMFGGILDDLEADGAAVMTISGSAGIDDDAEFFGSSRLVANGGQFDDELQFNDDATALINGANVDDDIVVADNAHVVIEDITVADSLEAEGTSLTEVSGGSITNVEVTGDGDVDNPTVVDISGGTFSIINAGSQTNVAPGVNGDEDDSVVRISGGVVTGATRSQGPGARIDVTGGEFQTSGVNELVAGAFGEMTINGGMGTEVEISAQTGGSIQLENFTSETTDLSVLGGGATMDVGGGTFGDAVLSADRGTLSLSGGDFDSLELNAKLGGLIEIVGFDFLVDGSPFPGGELVPASGQVSGVLLDGSPFDASFMRNVSNANFPGVIRLVRIPEPVGLSLALFGLALGATRRTRG